MTCDELRDDYQTYALGALDGPELDELRAHLARQCENCTPGVRRRRRVGRAHGNGGAPVNPPKRLRARVIALANPNGGQSRTAMWVMALVTALSVAFAVHIWMRHDAMHREFFEVWMPKYERLQTELAVLEDPAAKEVTFGKGAPRPHRDQPEPRRSFLGTGYGSARAGKDL